MSDFFNPSNSSNPQTLYRLCDRLQMASLSQQCNQTRSHCSRNTAITSTHPLCVPSVRMPSRMYLQVLAPVTPATSGQHAPSAQLCTGWLLLAV